MKIEKSKYGIIVGEKYTDANGMTGTVNALYVDNAGVEFAVLSGNDFSGYMEADRFRDSKSLKPLQTSKQNIDTSSERQSMDISSGLGIGGHGSDDHNLWSEPQISSPQFSAHKSSGQLWQPCANRGCDNEPVCLDCEYCIDRHCRCGE